MTLELVPWRGANVPVLNGHAGVSRLSQQDYLSWYSDPRWMGPPIPFTSYGSRPAEPISQTFEGFTQGMLYADGPVAAAEAYRLRVFGQAPVLYQEITDGRPGDFFDDDALDRLRSPWPGATLSDLMKRGLLYGDLAGNAFVVDMDDELVLVRPDWVEIVLAKREFRGGQVGWKQIGIVYYEGGPRSGDGVSFLPGEYAHFVPGLPDPLASYRGMSWLTPLVREIQADKSAMDHKVAFFENAASPNLAVSLPKEITPTQFEEFVDKMDAKHKGALNAYKTLYTAGGADVTVIGANMQQMDFSSVQGKGETRIANAAGVPPVLLSFSEGMQGSSLNAGNYTAAKRNFVDTTMRDLWQNWCGSVQQMEAFAPPRPKTRLWYDGRDIPFLHEDALDAANIQQTLATTITMLVREGFTADSAKLATVHEDMTLLEHTGLTSVQLQPPGSQDTDGDGTPDAEAAAADEYEAALDEFRAEFADDEPYIERRYYDVRVPKGFEGGGRFRKVSDRIGHALNEWLSGDGEADDPLEDFTRDQLRKASVEFGIAPRRGASAEELKLGLLKDARARFRGARAAKSPEAGKPVRFTLTGGSVDPAKVREVEVENRIRAAYRDLQGRTDLPKSNTGVGNPAMGMPFTSIHDAFRESGYVFLADIRDALGEDFGRREVDEVLRRLVREPGVRGIPVAARHGLAQRDHDSRLQMVPGSRDALEVDIIRIDDPSPRPVPDSKLRDLDVGVFTESNGKVALWEVSDSGERRKRVALVDDLAGLEAWATEHGESELAGWARKERAAPDTKTGDLLDDGAHTTREAKVNATADALGKLRSDVEVENKIRSAYRDALAAGEGPFGRPTNGRELRPGAHIMLADLRERSGVSRDEFDAVMTRLARGDGVSLAPQEDQKRLTPRQRDASVRFGDEHMHMVAIDDPSPRSAESDIIAHLDDGGLSRPELDALGKRLGIDVSGARSERAKAERIASGLAGGKAPTKATKAAKKAAPRAIVPPAYTVRRDLLALGTNDERRRYLADIGMSQAQANALAKELGARQTRISPDATIDSIVGHFDAGSTEPHASSTAKSSHVDLSHLRTLDPDAARDELDLRKVDELKTLLREQKLPVSGRKRDLVDRLVEGLGGGEGTSSTGSADQASVRDRLRRYAQSDLMPLASKLDIDLAQPIKRPGPVLTAKELLPASDNPAPFGLRLRTRDELAREIAKAVAANPDLQANVDAHLETLTPLPARAKPTGPGAVRQGKFDNPAVPARAGTDDSPIRWAEGLDPGWDEARTKRARSALRAYGRASFEINESLRGKPVEEPIFPREQTASHIEAIDDLMAASQTTAPMQQWRGVRDARSMFGDRIDGDLTGAQWQEDAFVSTSSDMGVSQYFATFGRGGMLMRIHVPTGTGAAQVKDVRGEAEALLQRGLRLRIVADHGWQPGWGYRLVDVEVVPDGS